MANDELIITVKLPDGPQTLTLDGFRSANVAIVEAGTAAFQAAAATGSETELEKARVEYLGKSSPLRFYLGALGGVDQSARSLFAKAPQEARSSLESVHSTLKSRLSDAAITARLAAEKVDVTLPVRQSPAERGRIHPISQVIDEIAAIFGDLGFSIAEGPDIETDHYNFTALNFPEGHPAREMHDTFFFQPDDKGERKLLRTHTSPVQIRTMESSSPPIRIVIPGKTYRQDSDATHSPMFHQVEGLVIDKSANVANMKWVLSEFCKAFFEVPSVNMRFRPSFFPFTEPSLEVDIQCDRSRPGEVRFGEGSDWMEILGCGMVHPNVLRHGGLDPDEYQGFAWGMGIDRIAMLKYGMPDLRAFFDADVRWLQHYGFRPLDMPTLFGGLSS